ncbi:hypothetical protein LCGC14_2805310, partial [marine sediment metagenome]
MFGSVTYSSRRPATVVSAMPSGKSRVGSVTTCFLLVSSLFATGCGAKKPNFSPAAVLLPGDGVRVPLDLRRGDPTVEVFVNGQGPYRFLVDTGCSTTIISERICKEAGFSNVRSAKATIRTAKGSSTERARWTRLDRLKLGNAVFEDFAVLVRDIGDWDGILGFSLFAKCLLTLDFPARELSLAPGRLDEANGEGRFSYRDSDQPYV